MSVEFRAALAFAERRAAYDLHRAELELRFIGPAHPRSDDCITERATRVDVLDALEEATAAAARKVLS